MSTTDKLWLKFSWWWEAPNRDHKRSSSSTMLGWVILFWKNVCVTVLLKAIWTVWIELLFVRSLALLVWYWRAYSSLFSLCFIVNQGRWIIFLCLIILFFKCLLIVLVLQGASTRFSIFLILTKFSFFTSRTVLLLNCGNSISWPSSRLSCSTQKSKLFKYLQITVLLCP